MSADTGLHPLDLLSLDNVDGTMDDIDAHPPLSPALRSPRHLSSPCPLPGPASQADVHRQKILASFSNVIRLLSQIDTITDVLISRRVFTVEDSRRVLAEGTEERQARQLLHILDRKPDHGIEVFMETLQEYNENIYHLVMEAEVQAITPPISHTMIEDETLRVYLESCMTQCLCADPHGQLELGSITQYLQQHCTGSGLPHTLTEDDVLQSLITKFKVTVDKPRYFGLPTHVIGLSWVPEIRERIVNRLIRRNSIHNEHQFPNNPPVFVHEDMDYDYGEMRPRASSLDKMDRTLGRVWKSVKGGFFGKSKSSSALSQMLKHTGKVLAEPLTFQPTHIPPPPPLPYTPAVPPRSPIAKRPTDLARSSSVTSDTIKLLAEQLHIMISPMTLETEGGAQYFLSRMPLVDRSKVVAQLIKGKTALYKAFYMRAYNLMVYMIEECSADVNQHFTPNSRTEKTTLLAQAAIANRTKDAELFMQHKAHVNLPDLKGSLSSISKIYAQDIDGEKSVFSAETFCVGMTPLMHACYRGHLTMAKYLVKCGAQITLSDDWERTCLMFSTSHRELLKYVISLGGEVDDQDKFGNTALHWAVSNGERVSIQLLLQSRIEINIKNYAGDTALHMAIKKNSPHLVKLLLDNGADIYARNKDKEDSLWLAILSQQDDIVTMLLKKHQHDRSLTTP